LFNLAVDSKLREYDLVRVQIDDVCVGSRMRDRTTVIQIQKKTGRPVQFEITEQTRPSIDAWLSSRAACSSDILAFSRANSPIGLSSSGTDRSNP
jgi:hypothetical protein